MGPPCRRCVCTVGVLRDLDTDRNSAYHGCVSDQHDDSDNPAPPTTAPDEATPTIVEAEASPQPKPPKTPTTAIDWPRSRITPGLVRALVQAQASAVTVGKSSKVDREPGERGPKYSYASADTMIAEASERLNAAGIAWVCASRTVDAPAVELGTYDAQGNPTQWVVGLVVTESVLLHVDDDDEIGMLVTTAECCSIGSRSRPADKADRAAETYLRGYLARDLVALDRGVTPDDEDVDARRDGSDDEGGTRRSSSSSRSAAGTRATSRDRSARDDDADTRDEINRLWSQLKTAGGRDPDWKAICAASGLPGPIKVKEADGKALRAVRDHMRDMLVASEAKAADDKGAG